MLHKLNLLFQFNIILFSERKWLPVSFFLSLDVCILCLLFLAYHVNICIDILPIYHNKIFHLKFKTSVPHGDVLSPKQFYPFITFTSTHTSTSTAKKYIQPYLHNFVLCSLQTLRKYTGNLDPKLNNTVLPKATHPNGVGLTLDTKLTSSTHIHNISVYAHNRLQIIKELTATEWGKQEETHITTCKAVMRPPWSMHLLYGRLLHPRPALTNCKSCRRQHLELPQDATRHKHTTSAWRNTHTSHTRAPTASLLTIQTENTASITSLTQTYNMLQHSKAQTHYLQQRPLHNKHSHRPPDSHYNGHKTNMRHIHAYIVFRHLVTRCNHKILRTPPLHISSS